MRVEMGEFHLMLLYRRSSRLIRCSIIKSVDTVHIKRQLLTSAAIIVGSIVAAAGILYVMVGRIDSTTGDIVKNEGIINDQAGLLGVVASLKQQASQASVYRAAINQLLPGQNGLIGFSQWVTDIANRYQVTASVSFQNNTLTGAAKAGSAQLGQMPFSLSANGTPDNLKAFFEDLESKSGGFLVSFSGFDMSNSSPDYKLTAQGIVFFQQ
jgi:hypothetical protein